MSECSYEGVRHNAFVRVSVILLVLHSEALNCQHTTDHRKVPHRVVPYQETRAEQRDVPGSWGAWGPWSSCSRTCAKGVQEQSRPCLRVFPMSSEYPYTRTRASAQQPGHVIPALQPTAHLHHGNSSSQREMRKHRVSQSGAHRRGHMVPGRYGYGRAPSVHISQTDKSQDAGRSSSHRHRRSPEGNLNLQGFKRQGDHHTNYPGTSRNPQQNGRSFVHRRLPQQPTNNPVWAPLYQPGRAEPGPHAENHQEIQPGNQQPDRAYDPLPVSFCNGEHARYKSCTNSACLPSSRAFRAVQCSSYNSKPFMGRLYEWEPFNEAPVEQQCELHCRAIGFRFYVRQSKAVTDGTPCGQNDSTVCVAGKCVAVNVELQSPPWRNVKQFLDDQHCANQLQTTKWT